MDEIVRKVRALLLKAEGTIGAESEAFMAKVRELMAKHQLEMHQLRKEPDPLGKHNHGLLLQENWEVAVCEAGAEYFGCAAVFNRFEDDATVVGCTLFGRQSACATSMEMLAFWITEVKRVANLLMVPARAVGEAFAVRLIELIAKHGPAPSTGTDLVPIDEAKALAMDEAVETQDLVVNTTYESRLAAEQISLSLQASGGRRHTSIAKE